MHKLSWLPPPAELHLPANEIHVWRISLDVPEAQLQHLLSTLSDDEVSRADRFLFPYLRQRFIAGRGILRAVLARYLLVAPGSLRFDYTAYGKPFLLQPPEQEPLNFNLSHADGLALLAVVRARAIGVDIESSERTVEFKEIASRFFAPAEQHTLLSLPPSQLRDSFFACWTRKEAYIKAHGEGLSLPLDQFCVSLTPGEPARLVSTEADPHEAARWSLLALEPGPGYMAALAVEGEGWQIACWQWPE